MIRVGVRGAKLTLGKPCLHGHAGWRYSYGRCVDCMAERYAISFDLIARASEAKRKAKAAGKPTYKGRPCKHGHSGVRFIWGGCVECRNEVNRRQQRRRLA